MSLSRFTAQVEYLSNADNLKLILQEAITIFVDTSVKADYLGKRLIRVEGLRRHLPRILKWLS
jgi:hypothetical protein